MNLQLLSVILQGFIDSLSLHWALKYLAKPKILQLFLKVFVANLLLLVGTRSFLLILYVDCSPTDSLD